MRRNPQTVPPPSLETVLRIVKSIDFTPYAARPILKNREIEIDVENAMKPGWPRAEPIKIQIFVQDTICVYCTRNTPIHNRNWGIETCNERAYFLKLGTFFVRSGREYSTPFFFDDRSPYYFTYRGHIFLHYGYTDQTIQEHIEGLLSEGLDCLLGCCHPDWLTLSNYVPSPLWAYNSINLEAVIKAIKFPPNININYNLENSKALVTLSGLEWPLRFELFITKDYKPNDRLICQLICHIGMGIASPRLPDALICCNALNAKADNGHFFIHLDQDAGKGVLTYRSAFQFDYWYTYQAVRDSISRSIHEAINGSITAHTDHAII